MLVCDKRDRAITYEFCRDLHLTLIWCFKKRSVERKVKFSGRFFQTKLLSHKVCRLLPSLVLLHKFTITL